jgi:hypothetical protein
MVTVSEEPNPLEGNAGLPCSPGARHASCFRRAVRLKTTIMRGLLRCDCGTPFSLSMATRDARLWHAVPAEPIDSCAAA